MHFAAISDFDAGVDPSAPLKTLHHTHEAILAELGALSRLPLLVGRFGQAMRLRRMADAAMALFQQEVVQHHAEEEEALFPAVLRSATPGEERERVLFLAGTLSAEHRAFEKTWQRLEAPFAAAATGRFAALDLELLARLVHAYTAHARREEQQFLPLAQHILQRNPEHLGALGVELRLRRAPQVQAQA
jgi:hemerythrin-like domain-containing protein